MQLRSALLLLLVGCASNPPPTTTAATLRRATPAAPSIPPAHQMVVLATGCWFGGVWNDALGESPHRDRCMEVLKRAYGAVDAQRLERLRAVEPNEVGTLADRIQNMNGSEALVREF